MDAALRLADMPERVQRSKPRLVEFCVDGIQYQRECVDLVRRDFDYSKGNLEILLSGSFGSAKSVLLAHLGVTHCLMYRKARVGICRRALPDIKATIFKEILEHLEDGPLIEGRDYWVNRTSASIRFWNGSEIVAIYWSDRKYKRVRSLKLSMLLIEEATENDDEDREGFEQAKARLRRLPHVPENVLICATNPDSPAHWLYDYFIAPNSGGAKHPTRFVFYSRTEQNIYLDPVYIMQLRRDMDPKRARRYLDGEWIELTKDRVYYAYSVEDNFRGITYEIDFAKPVYISWDFNIGVGKPLSVTLGQYDRATDTFHFFGECIVEGMRTEDSLDEMAGRGVFDWPVEFIVCGDATGRHRDTRNIRDDYEIIRKWLANHRNVRGEPLRFQFWVPTINPPVRERHNWVNTYCENSVGERRLFVYKGAPTIHKGLRLVDLKKGADYVEDDSKAYQHCTTALGYTINAVRKFGNAQPQRTVNF